MKRPFPVIDLKLNRRQFLVGASAIGIAACGPAPENSSDAGTPTDAGAAPVCGNGSESVGAATLFVEGSPRLDPNGEAYIVRDSGGLYALSAICTHQGCQVEPQGSDFYCPCHQSRFDINGNVVNGPARQPLVHFAMCVDNDGLIGIDTSMTVPTTTRLDR